MKTRKIMMLLGMLTVASSAFARWEYHHVVIDNTNSWRNMHMKEDNKDWWDVEQDRWQIYTNAYAKGNDNSNGEFLDSSDKESHAGSITYRICPTGFYDDSYCGYMLHDFYNCFG